MLYYVKVFSLVLSATCCCVRVLRFETGCLYHIKYWL